MIQEPLEQYSNIQALVQKEIDDKILSYAASSRYNRVDVPAHTHDGVNSPRIEFENITGVTVTSITPTDTPEDGTIRLYNSGGTRKLYAFISGVWYSATLT